MGFVIDPDARLDYEFDWSKWLAEGETISDYELSTTDGITIDDDSSTDTSVTVWLKDGEAGAHCTVTCHIVTNGEREDDRSFIVDVEER